MAKRSNPAGVPSENDGPKPSAGDETAGAAAQQDVLGDFAEDLGKFLGSVQNRATTWLQQRKDIAEQLTRIRDTANEYLQQLGAESERLVGRFEEARRGPGRPPKAAAAPPPGSSEAPAPASATGRRTMSEEARARIAEAQRRRWAKLRRKSGK